MMSTEPTFAQKACERYAAIFKEVGYPSENDEQKNDRILIVTAEERKYIFVFDGDDEGFIRFIFPNFWEIESEEEYGRALEAASAASRSCKFAKVYLTDDKEDVMASLEFFDNKNSADKETILRYFKALRNIVNVFRQEMQKGMK